MTKFIQRMKRLKTGRNNGEEKAPASEVGRYKGKKRRRAEARPLRKQKKAPAKDRLGFGGGHFGHAFQALAGDVRDDAELAFD